MKHRADHGRIRGRKGVALRLARLHAEPLCRLCKRKGKTTLAVTVDHIIPLADGGLDIDDNCQSLCQPCHDAKTSNEVGGWNSGVNNHPDWLKKSAIPLTIVCGPPASGKTTYVAANARQGDTVIDLDAIRFELDPSFKVWSGTDGLKAGIRKRNDMLGDLSRATKGSGWFIISAPTRAERKWWADKLGGQVVLLDPGKAECVNRCRARGTPQAIEWIEDWHRRSALPWKRAVRIETGVDGWPI